MTNEYAPAVIINCTTGEVTERPLTLEEIAEKQVLAQEQENRVQQIEAIAILKNSAKQKLISGQPLTEEEANILVF